MSDPTSRQISGVTVELSNPYEEGHICTAAEAKALNQVRAENIGNNNRATIKKMVEEAGGEVDSKLTKAIQKLISEYELSYEFTLAAAGGSTRLDPLTKEARKLAKNAIIGKLKKAGKTMKAYEDEVGKDAVTAKIMELAENPTVLEVAEKNIKNRATLANI